MSDFKRENNKSYINQRDYILKLSQILSDKYISKEPDVLRPRNTSEVSYKRKLCQIKTRAKTMKVIMCVKNVVNLYVEKKIILCEFFEWKVL